MNAVNTKDSTVETHKVRDWINQPRNAAIIAITVLALSGLGYFYAQQQSEQLAVSAVSRAAWLAQNEIAQRLQRFEAQNRRLARTNLELQLPEPSDASWAPLSFVEYRADGSIYFEYADASAGANSDPALLWRLRATPEGSANSCSSRGISAAVLAQVNLQCDQQKISVMLPILPRTTAVIAAEAKAATETPEFMHLDVKRDVVAADHVLAAIGKDDAPALEKLKAEGIDVCAATPEGRLPLAEAARSGHLKALEALIAVPCNVQQIEPFSQSTALTSAVSIKHPAAVDLLLAAKSDPNFAAPGKPTAWQLLADTEDPAAMQMRDSLHAHGVNLDTVDANGQTLLIRAVRNNSIDLLRWLIIKGANLNIQDKDGRSAVMHSVLNPQGDAALKFLISSGKADLNLRDTQDYTALGRVMLLVDTKRQQELKHMLTQAGARG